MRVLSSTIRRQASPSAKPIERAIPPRWWFAATISSCSFLTQASGVAAWDNVILQQAASLREKWGLNELPSPDALAYPSFYTKPDGSGLRGFCNWAIPGRVMVGQYPGPSPEATGPSSEESRQHIQSMTQDANIRLFCCLQSEVPPQDDWSAWEKAKGTIFLEGERVRKQFPNPFVHYGITVREFAPDCQFLHAPIEDLSVPNSNALQSLLLKLMLALDETDERGQGAAIYVHCWGGRGRAGIVASCLLSLLYPNEDSTAILDLVQAGYDSREGSELMPFRLSKSPQTEDQRDFVRAFVKERKQQQSYTR